jgi:hypothetical protein
MPASYSFVSHWQVPVPRDRAWAELERALRPGTGLTWWPGLTLAMPPRRLVPGERMVLAVRSPLGYALRVRLELTDVVPGRVLAATSEGDLRGSGRVTVEPRGGEASVVFHWDVETTRAWMNITGPVLRPVFELAHRWVMRRGERGMRAALAGGSEPRNAGNPAESPGGAARGD